MITLPNAKINIGLKVLGKRSDGYHNIESVFYPVGLSDSLELLPAEGPPKFNFSTSGLPIPGDVSSNLCLKAYELIAKDYPLPAVKVHLHKHIPIGAGLGGGSADAAFFIRMLNDTFELGLAWGELHHYAKQVGSDCSFFISNRPAMITGRGEEMESMNFSLSGYKLVLVCPPVHISTKEAYSMVNPGNSGLDLETFVTDHPLKEWKDVVLNDFEKNIFLKYPQLQSIKQALYQAGAIYASMTGSGAAIYGVFESDSELSEKFDSCFLWEGILA